MEQLSEKEIRDRLFALGLRRGMSVMAHSSLSSLGGVAGGADTVIDALIEVLGGGGTLLMPSFANPDEVFDHRKSQCGLGKIPDDFWRREGVLRSMHPTHSVAARGKLAGYFLSGHEKASTPYGEGTPYKRLVDNGGYVLLLGVDLDRMTLLHTAEALADAPYLTTVRKKYRDTDGKERELAAGRMAGPHRNFIGLDGAFRKEGFMRTGKVGRAVCRLVDARAAFDYCLERMKDEPCLMLCDNPSCGDCNLQRGKIREDEFAGEDFTLSVSAGGLGPASGELPALLGYEGVKCAEIPADDVEIFKKIIPDWTEGGFSASAVNLGPVSGLGEGLLQKAASAAETVKTGRVVLSLRDGSFKESAAALESFKKAAYFMLGKKIRLFIENGSPGSAGLGAVMKIIAELNNENLCLAYNPANFAFEGGKPFLDFVRKLKFAGIVYVNDGIKNSPGEFMLPGEGNAEIKEIVSALRARSFTGALTFKNFAPGSAGLKAHAGAFRRLLSRM